MMATASTNFRASKLSDGEMEDARRLRARFNDYKAAGGTQAGFALEFDFPGGAPMISQHLGGQRPISLKQAESYMRGFKCNLEDISPTLAGKIPKDLSASAENLDKQTEQIMRILGTIPENARRDAYSAALQALIPFLPGASPAPTRAPEALAQPETPSE